MLTCCGPGKLIPGEPLAVPHRVRPDLSKGLKHDLGRRRTDNLITSNASKEALRPTGDCQSPR